MRTVLRGNPSATERIADGFFTPMTLPKGATKSLVFTSMAFLVALAMGLGLLTPSPLENSFGWIFAFVLLSTYVSAFYALVYAIRLQSYTGLVVCFTALSVEAGWFAVASGHSEALLLVFMTMSYAVVAALEDFDSDPG